METQPSLEYFLSVGLALTSAYLIRGTWWLKLIIGLIVAYISLQFMNMLFPKLNQWANAWQYYFETRALGELNATNYMQIFPPMLIVLVVALAIVFMYA